MPHDRQTIFALASAAGRAGVAVVRLSGPDALRIVRTLTHRDAPPPRRAERRRFRDADGALIDNGLVLSFPAPASFTGEDVIELHGHGGRAVLDRLTARLCELGALPAEPGAFSRRAFENGKLDLTQAEAIADLVDAESEAQRRQALRQMTGALQAEIEHWRGQLVRIAALLEAAIDFPDEDLPEDLADRVAPAIGTLRRQLEQALQDGERGERVREGYRVAIVGAPNAGKSSLLNALARREAAIVSDLPGTTRDVIEVRLELAGYVVWVADTAGLRETADAVESEGVRRALARAEAADLRIAVIDGASGAVSDGVARVLRPGDLTVWSKKDLWPDRAPHAPGVALSLKTGDGLADLEAALSAKIRAELETHGAPTLTRLRHRLAVSDAAEALSRAEAQLYAGAEMAAEDVRLAARALGRVTGQIDVEDVLGEIFASFCIGK